MHEFSLTERLYQIALTNADLKPGERIRRLKIRLDPDSGYAPEAIRFYFAQLAQGTAAQGAKLDFELAPEPRHIALTELEINESPAATPANRPPPPKNPAMPADSMTRWHLQIYGAVQNIGFGLFARKLARQLGLSGWLHLTATGVEMELQGPATELDHFLYHLKHDAPLPAGVLSVEIIMIPPATDEPAGLEIRPNRNQVPGNIEP